MNPHTGRPLPKFCQCRSSHFVVFLPSCLPAFAFTKYLPSCRHSLALRSVFRLACLLLLLRNACRLACLYLLDDVSAVLQACICFTKCLPSCMLAFALRSVCSLACLLSLLRNLSAVLHTFLCFCEVSPCFLRLWFLKHLDMIHHHMIHVKAYFHNLTSFVYGRVLHVFHALVH